ASSARGASRRRTSPPTGRGATHQATDCPDQGRGNCSMAHDIVIRNARLRDGLQVDIAIANGKYAAVRPGIKKRGAVDIDADGHLVTESFVIAHKHLAKVMTGDWIAT